MSKRWDYCIAPALLVVALVALLVMAECMGDNGNTPYAAIGTSGSKQGEGNVMAINEDTERLAAHLEKVARGLRDGSVVLTTWHGELALTPDMTRYSGEFSFGVDGVDLRRRGMSIQPEKAGT